MTEFHPTDAPRPGSPITIRGGSEFEHSLSGKIQYLYKETKTGKAILDHIMSIRSHRVRFINNSTTPSERENDVCVNTAAFTQPTTLVNQSGCLTQNGPGNATNARILMPDLNCMTRDRLYVTIVHELVHASRLMTGSQYCNVTGPVPAGYSNIEEYIAVIVQNIIASEKFISDFAYGYVGNAAVTIYSPAAATYRPGLGVEFNKIWEQMSVVANSGRSYLSGRINVRSFGELNSAQQRMFSRRLASDTRYGNRTALTTFRDSSSALFRALAGVSDAPFNPVRDY